MSERRENLLDSRVTYTLQHDGKFYIVENVPARVDQDTGEQFFSPATVERLQKWILDKEAPNRTIETSVYRYAD